MIAAYTSKHFCIYCDLPIAFIFTLPFLIPVFTSLRIILYLVGVCIFAVFLFQLAVSAFSILHCSTFLPVSRFLVPFYLDVLVPDLSKSF